MPKPSNIHRIRGFLADRLGLRSSQARSGEWWEIDMILIVLLGSFILGVSAWISF